ncbi:MAG: hypothetical protein IPK77_11460 [Cellvibrio sp.]|nr:hypothetical protein [Cellvibrio sp.]
MSILVADTDEEIKMAIKSLFGDKMYAENIGLKAREFVLGAYAWNVMFSRIKEVLKKVR